MAQPEWSTPLAKPTDPEICTPPGTRSVLTFARGTDPVAINRSESSGQTSSWASLEKRPTWQECWPTTEAIQAVDGQPWASAFEKAYWVPQFIS